VTRIRVGQPRIHGSIPSSKARAFSVLHNFHIVGSRRIFFVCGGGWDVGGRVKMLTHLHPLPMWIMRGAIPSLLHMTSCCSRGHLDIQFLLFTKAFAVNEGFYVVDLKPFCLFDSFLNFLQRKRQRVSIKEYVSISSDRVIHPLMLAFTYISYGSPCHFIV